VYRTVLSPSIRITVYWHSGLVVKTQICMWGPNPQLNYWGGNIWTQPASEWAISTSL